MTRIPCPSEAWDNYYSDLEAQEELEEEYRQRIEAGLTIQGFLDHIGIAPLESALRAIDQYNVEHVWIVLGDGVRRYYHTDGLNELRVSAPIYAVGAGCIGGDDSDWEYSNEMPVDLGDSIGDIVDRVRADVLDALDVERWRREAGAEE